MDKWTVGRLAGSLFFFSGIESGDRCMRMTRGYEVQLCETVVVDEEFNCEDVGGEIGGGRRRHE